ncbi:MAG: glycerophosphodiester phosphodiesterase [Gammaproteobacteria bacterium]
MLPAMSEPMVVAHRGANVDLPEQSLAAYVRAVEVGADAVECDVRITKDGHLVCHHDRTVDRTSDGTGAIADLTLAELQKLNFAKTAPSPDSGERHQIVTFVSLLRLLSEAPQKVKLLVEAKHPSRFGAKVEHALHAALSEFPAVDATVMSFARAAVARYRALDPDVPLVWLFEYPMGAPPPAAGIVGPKLELIQAKPKVLQRAVDSGRQAYVWTANTPDEVRYVRDVGAAAVITDDPEMALKALGRS